MLSYPFRYLSEAGISVVKTDVQFLLDHLDDAEDRRRLIQSYQQAWSSAFIRHFNAKAISCMAQIAQNLFYTQLRKDFPTLVVRNSDDFFPNEPSAHSWHIFCNAHNAVLTQHLNLLPDWDMFQTNHTYSGLHAAGRCLSGGRIYITDEPGVHDLKLISQMTAKTPHRTVILRPRVGRSMQIYMEHVEPALCKIGTLVPVKDYDIGILGVFNVGKGDPLAEFMSLGQFPAVSHDKKYIIRAHSVGDISEPLTLQSEIPFVFVDLPFWGWEVLSAYPIETFVLSSPGGKHTTNLAVLGLLHKITGAAAMTNVVWKIIQDPKSVRIQVALKALGVLGQIMM